MRVEPEHAAWPRGSRQPAERARARPSGLPPSTSVCSVALLGCPATSSAIRSTGRLDLAPGSGTRSSPTAVALRDGRHDVAASHSHAAAELDDPLARAPRNGSPTGPCRRRAGPAPRSRPAPMTATGGCVSGVLIWRRCHGCVQEADGEGRDRTGTPRFSAVCSTNRATSRRGRPVLAAPLRRRKADVRAGFGRCRESSPWRRSTMGRVGGGGLASKERVARPRPGSPGKVRESVRRRARGAGAPAAPRSRVSGPAGEGRGTR